MGIMAIAILLDALVLEPLPTRLLAVTSQRLHQPQAGVPCSAHGRFA